MGTTVFINGREFRPEEARVSVFDRGLLYGDSVFETLGTYGGRAFALVEHVERLQRSAARVFIELDVSPSELIQEIERAIGAAQNPESYVRVIVTRGSGELGLDPAHAVAPQRIIIVTPLQRPARSAYEDGIKAITYHTMRSTDFTAAAGAKVGNYLVAVLAMKEAKAADASEALILDASGRVIEGATSNVFLVRDSGLVTPPEESGILVGITRAVVLEAARREGISVQYSCPTLEEARGASEVFITSSIRQMLAVTQIDGVVVGEGRPGPIFRKLLERFFEIVEERSGVSRA